jgi:soluble lytic murein transglycosylase
VHADLYGQSPYDADNLYLPGYNAALGTAELGRRKASLGDLLGGTSTPAVVASYNGGEDAVRRWVTAWGNKPDFDEFSEDVGYPETRQYVRRVLGYEMQYRWVYGD